MSAKTWKEVLADQMPEDLAHQIDIFEGQISLRKQGKLDEKVFAETRLRRGAYGQRYDNGQRHDGVATRSLDFPSNGLTKGPETIWDAPGMMRIKVPYGGLTPDQLDVLADLAEEYSDDIIHITTRQDIQLHFIHIDDTPDLMRRLAAVNITTQEACGNSVRNITGCPLAGVCKDESFDTTPYADALTQYLLGHPDIQDFGRKFKVAFSGCEQHACGLVRTNDLGYIAKTFEENGETKRGFDIYVGGGLGTVPHQAKVLLENVPEEEILPYAQAISRVFARLGEKKNRNRARIKFLIKKIGLEAFKEEVFKEFKELPHDDRWTAYLEGIENFVETPLKPPSEDELKEWPEGFFGWHKTNVYKQRQKGYNVVTVRLPLGDMSSWQARELATLSRKYLGENLRTTIEQNIVLRWVSDADLPAVYTELKAIGLGLGNAGTIVDMTSCPGTDTCKLGIAASRGLTGELGKRLEAKMEELPESVQQLRIKASGCFNSCGQHHVADIGFFGNSRKFSNIAVPHFQVVLGGKWQENGGSYGLAAGAVPSKLVPEVLDTITGRYVEEKEENESFQDWIERLGKKEVRAMLKPFMNKVPPLDVDPSFYSDWGDSRIFSIGDIGIGECAGEVVSLFSMEISKAESESFEAQIALESGEYQKANESAYKAMLLSAQALIRTQNINISDDPNDIVDQFKTRFYDTQVFFDKYAKGKFANYLLKRHKADELRFDQDSAHQLIEEAMLFIEATHACESRITATQ